MNCLIILIGNSRLSDSVKTLTAKAVVSIQAVEKLRVEALAY